MTPSGIYTHLLHLYFSEYILALKLEVTSKRAGYDLLLLLHLWHFLRTEKEQLYRLSIFEKIFLHHWSHLKI